MRIVVKVGSALLASGKGIINIELLIEIVRQIAELVRVGNQVILVSSGAVASDPCKKRSNNLRAGVGQARLISRYVEFFGIYRIGISQHLLIDRDILGEGEEITKRTLLEALDNGIVPIINGNDVVDDKELQALKVCADNDRLFKLVCFMVEADAGIICFNEEGLRGKSGEFIYQVKIDELELIDPYIKEGSELGHGNDGMATKVAVLAELAERGIVSILSPGRRKDFILRSLKNEKRFATRFIAV